MRKPEFHIRLLVTIIFRGETCQTLRRSNAISASGDSGTCGIRLTYLVPELLEYMDEGRMAFSVGVELSYLDTDFQYAVLDAMSQEDCTPSYAQAVRMKNMYREEMLTEDEIYSIVCEEKANQQEKVSFKAEDLRRFFPKSYTTQDMEKAIIQIVEADYRRRQRNRDDGAR